MPKDDRNTLEVLKAELNFVKKGGYVRLPGEPLRAQLILEDSPTCMNYYSSEGRVSCTECLLMQFVPAEKQGEKVPCRHIPVTSCGNTLLDLYRGGTEEQIEEAFANWLQEQIARLESVENTGSPSV